MTPKIHRKSINLNFLLLETNISNPRALVVQKVDNAIHNCNPVTDNAVGFPNTYSLDSNLSSV